MNNQVSGESGNMGWNGTKVQGLAHRPTSVVLNELLNAIASQTSEGRIVRGTVRMITENKY
jgi:hypothetical protein